jgi:integrase
MIGKPRPQAEFVQIAECLDRNPTSGPYFALVKRKGKQIRKSLRATDRKLAERRLAEFRKQAASLTASPEERRTPFSALAQRWLRIHNVHLKPSSADRNVRCVKELEKTFGKLAVTEITTRRCEDWMASRGRGIAASTFNKDALVLRAILDYAQRDGLILDNPARVVKRRKVVDKEIVIPTREEYAKLLEEIAKLDERARDSAKLVQLLALSGMRLGEATRIVWREVDFEKGQFTVSGGEVGTKNGETRIVPLFSRLRRFLEEIRPEGEGVGRERIVGIDSTKSAMESACKAGDLPRFTHHSLRHFFVSNAIEVGVDFKTIAAWIGHKDGGMLVAKRYGHLRATHSIEMARLLD